MSSNPPLQGKYWYTVAFVLLALVPDLLLSTAMPLLRPTISTALHAPPSALALGETFSNAGWAFGAVLASDLAQRVSSYKLNALYECVFVVGSMLGATAPTAALLVVGRILQGTATGMLLVSALPPLIRNFGVDRIGTTATVTDIGLFGAVAAGPLLGGYVVATDTWRWFFAVVGLLALGALLLTFLVVERKPGYHPGFPFDAPAIALAAAGAGLTFYGVSQLGPAAAWSAPIVWIPTTLGLLATVVLIVYQYRHENALMPVKPISTTYPVMGILAGVLSGAAYTGLLELLLLYLQDVLKLKPLGAGLLLWPGLGTAILASVIFGRLFNTRYVLLLPLSGMLALIVGAWLLTTCTPMTGTGATLWVAGLLGLGAGLTVSPGLFMAGLSVAPKLVGRAVALVELLRLAGAFAMVPAFLYFARIYGMRPAQLLLGLHLVVWVILIGVAGAIGLITAIFFLGGARVHPPDLKAYLEEGREALDSPPFGAAADREAFGPAVSRGLKSAVGADDEEAAGDGRENSWGRGQRDDTSSPTAPT